MEALGGLGLFILGMKFMSEGLQKLAGERLRNSLEKITGNRLTAALMGSCLASLLQSGSAASILVVGFVNAGLLSLYQSLGVLLGVGIGTTLAIQLIAFKISFFSLPSIFVGVILRCFSSRRRWVNVGTLMLGAGLVFFGLHIMEVSFAPLKQSTLFNGIHHQFLSWRIMAVLLGALLSFLIQSSSAAIGIVIALASSGLLHFDSAVAMVIGEGLGSSLIAVIAAINGTLAAKRTALIYIIINCVAIALVLISFPLFLRMVQFFSPGEVDFTVQNLNIFGAAPLSSMTKPYVARHLANAHTVFSILSATFFLPLIGFFARSATVILPGREGDIDIEPRPKFIDMRVVNTPSIAFIQARSEMKRMAEVAGSMFHEMVEQFHSYNARSALRIKQKEELLDVLQRDISSFLITLSRQPVSAENAIEIPTMLQIINELEHMGDQSEAVMEYMRRKKEEKLRFSGTAMAEIKTFAAQVAEIVVLAVNSLCAESASVSTASNARNVLDAINKAYDTLQRNHTKRLHSGKCTIVAGLVYGDIIASFAKIAQFSFNIIATEKELQ
jgi:phosphate:Na+ symporter